MSNEKAPEMYNVSLDEVIKRQRSEGINIRFNNRRSRRRYLRRRYNIENQKTDNRKRLRVEGLSKDIQNPDLTKIFEPYGKLIRCGIKFDKLGNSTGIADVEYETHEECEEALKKLDCFKINDVEIHVKYAPNSGRFRRMRSAGFIRRNYRRLNRSRRNMSTRRRRNIGIRRSRAGLRQRNNFERKKRRFFAKSLGRRRKQD